MKRRYMPDGMSVAESALSAATESGELRQRLRTVSEQLLAAREQQERVKHIIIQAEVRRLSAVLGVPPEKALGSNEAAREAATAALLSSSTDYQGALAIVRDLERQQWEAKDALATYQDIQSARHDYIVAFQANVFSLARQSGSNGQDQPPAH